MPDQQKPLLVYQKYYMRIFSRAYEKFETILAQNGFAFSIMD